MRATRAFMPARYTSGIRQRSAPVDTRAMRLEMRRSLPQTGCLLLGFHASLTPPASTRAQSLFTTTPTVVVTCCLLAPLKPSAKTLSLA